MDIIGTSIDLVYDDNILTITENIVSNIRSLNIIRRIYHESLYVSDNIKSIITKFISEEVKLLPFDDRKIIFVYQDMIGLYNIDKGEIYKDILMDDIIHQFEHYVDKFTDTFYLIIKIEGGFKIVNIDIKTERLNIITSYNDYLKLSIVSVKDKLYETALTHHGIEIYNDNTIHYIEPIEDSISDFHVYVVNNMLVVIVNEIQIEVRNYFGDDYDREIDFLSMYIFDENLELKSKRELNHTSYERVDILNDELYIQFDSSSISKLNTDDYSLTEIDILSGRYYFRIMLSPSLLLMMGETDINLLDISTKKLIEHKRRLEGKKGHYMQLSSTQFIHESILFTITGNNIIETRLDIAEPLFTLKSNKSININIRFISNNIKNIILKISLISIQMNTSFVLATTDIMCKKVGNIYTILVMDNGVIKNTLDINIMKMIYDQYLYVSDNTKSIITNFMDEKIELKPLNTYEFLVIYQDILGFYNLNNNSLINFISSHIIDNYFYYINKFNDICYFVMGYNDGINVLEIDRKTSVVNNRDIKDLGGDYVYTIINIKEKVYLIIKTNYNIQIRDYEDNKTLSNVKPHLDIINGFEMHVINNLLVIITFEDDRHSHHREDDIEEGRYIYVFDNETNKIKYTGEIYNLYGKIWVFDNILYLLDPNHAYTVNMYGNLQEIYQWKDDDDVIIYTRNRYMLTASIILIIDNNKWMRVINITTEKAIKHEIKSKKSDKVNFKQLASNQFIYSSILFTIINDEVSEIKLDIEEPLFIIDNDKNSYKEIKGVNIPIVTNNIKNIILKFI